MIDWTNQRYAVVALLSAALFGISTPLAKHLLGDASPLLLAGLLYLGSGVGLLLWTALRQLWLRRNHAEAPLTRRDYAWLAAATATGGVAAPVLLLWGLAGLPASATALLLNFESVLTILLAAAFFAEAVSRRVWFGAVVMLGASAVLTYVPGAELPLSPHALAVLGACLLWGLDNNLTRHIAASDPVRIAMVKGLVAGTVNTAIAMRVSSVPSVTTALQAMGLGALSYGASLVLFIYALRALGAARTSAHWSIAPFVGAGVAILLLDEPLTLRFGIAVTLMGFATWLVLTEYHIHEHQHEHLVHTHRHTHDEHHRHLHTSNEGPEPHVHEHVHEPVTHRHAHVPDIHHRHHH